MPNDYTKNHSRRNILVRTRLLCTPDCNQICKHVIACCVVVRAKIRYSCLHSCWKNFIYRLTKKEISVEATSWSQSNTYCTLTCIYTRVICKLYHAGHTIYQKKQSFLCNAIDTHAIERELRSQPNDTSLACASILWQSLLDIARFLTFNFEHRWIIGDIVIICEV